MIRPTPATRSCCWFPPSAGRRWSRSARGRRRRRCSGISSFRARTKPCFSTSDSGAAMDERERYDRGLSVRRAVLGDAHVDRTLAKKDSFNEEFQELITRYAWGEIWTRPGLPRHTRSLITVAMMVALNRADEFRLHVRAAFNNGVTRDQIKDCLLYTSDAADERSSV